MRAIPTVMLGMVLATHLVQAQNPQPSAPRYRLQHAHVEASPQHGTRYILRARLAPTASHDERQEGENFVLTGHLVKAAVGCGPAGDAIFKNGFEG